MIWLFLCLWPLLAAAASNSTVECPPSFTVEDRAIAITTMWLVASIWIASAVTLVCQVVAAIASR